MNLEITLQEAIERYQAHLEAEGKSKRTLYTYGKDFEQIMAFFSPEKPLQSITRAQVGKFYKSEALTGLPGGKERAPQTIKKTIRVLRMFLVWSVGQGFIDELPLTKDTPMGRSKALNA